MTRLDFFFNWSSYSFIVIICPYFRRVYLNLTLENSQHDAFHNEPLNSNRQDSKEPNENVSKRKRVRRRLSSDKDEHIRAAQKRRDRWSNRRELVEGRMLTLTGVVFIVLFVHVGLHLIIDQHLPLLNELLFGLAALALAIWGVFRFVEWLVTKKYRNLTKQQRSDRVSHARDLQRTAQPSQRKTKTESEP